MHLLFLNNKVISRECQESESLYKTVPDKKWVQSKLKKAVNTCMPKYPLHFMNVPYFLGKKCPVLDMDKAASATKNWEKKFPKKIYF